MPPAKPLSPTPISPARARRIWLRAQRLDAPAPFGSGPEATSAVVEHLGYVQIDTINVIERAHHHILWSRLPAYRREDLAQALSVERSVFEYWTHALAYVPTRDFRFFIPEMRRRRADPGAWLSAVAPRDLARVLARIRREGPLTIRDIADDALVEKDHPWASRKPSKRALDRAFLAGLVTIGARAGMLKTFDLTDRHFGWPPRPRPATARQILDYRLDRALRAQGLVSLDSICHLEPSAKPAIADLIEARIRRRRLVPATLTGADSAPHWIAPETLDAPTPEAERVHILSPFDPLIIQRKRLSLFFGYDHRFEAYVPQTKRVFGYFALPVLIGDRVAAAIDLKADRAARKLLIRRWTWICGPASGDESRIEEALGRLKAFQFAP